MSPLRALRPRDAHGAGLLAVDAVLQISALIEAMHGGIQRVATLRPPQAGARPDPIARLAYAGVRGVSSVVGKAIDLLGRQFDTSPEDAPPNAQREALLAALNGVVGDHLAARGNPLALPMRLRHADVALPLADPTALRAALPAPRSRIAVLLHGLCMTPWQWRRAEAGGEGIEALLEARGYRVLHLHYNSGRPIGDNGAELAAALQSLFAALAGRPDELLLIGHSMGGLVARSACLIAAEQGAGWVERPLTLITLGTPHHGAPLERAGHGVERLIEALPVVSPFARLARLRSAGITDLRHGRLHCGTAPSPPLPETVKLHAVAASLSKRAATSRPRGDGLVPVASALGHHRDPRRDLGIPPARQALIAGCGHIELLQHPDTLHVLGDWLARA